MESCEFAIEEFVSVDVPLSRPHIDAICTCLCLDSENISKRSRVWLGPPRTCMATPALVANGGQGSLLVNPPGCHMDSPAAFAEARTMYIPVQYASLQPEETQCRSA